MQTRARGLKSKVRYQGVVTTIEALAMQGLVRPHHAPAFMRRPHEKLAPAWFADLVDGSDCWEISPGAYLRLVEIAGGARGYEPEPGPGR